VIAADAAKRFSWHRQRRGIDFLDLRGAAIRDRWRGPPKRQAAVESKRDHPFDDGTTSSDVAVGTVDTESRFHRPIHGNRA